MLDERRSSVSTADVANAGGSSSAAFLAGRTLAAAASALKDSVKLTHARPAVAPVAPKTLNQTGLRVAQVSDLILKLLYMQGTLQGVSISRQLRLPFPVIDEVLVFLKDEKCIEVASGELLGRVSYRFQLTERGRGRAKEVLDQCRYVGPAPVTLEAYVRQCSIQSVAGTVCNIDSLREVFDGLVLPAELVDEIGAAVCSGRSIFLFGPPGNGKTQIARRLGRLLHRFGGEIYVPYAIQLDNTVITAFDPTVHEALDATEVEGTDSLASRGGEAARLIADNSPDLRWRRIRRPVIVTGGELTLEMLDLQFHVSSNTYTMPLHIKSNGGVFVVDDFGRQIVSPKALLNRWVLPLEERLDYLTLATGRKIEVPVEQLVIFSTNLDPADLTDDAFLRRMRHKIHVKSPNREQLQVIFRMEAATRGLDVPADIFDMLYAVVYGTKRSARLSDPRDLLEITQSICRFRNQTPHLSVELVAEAARRFFGEL